MIDCDGPNGLISEIYDYEEKAGMHAVWVDAVVLIKWRVCSMG